MKNLNPFWLVDNCKIFITEEEALREVTVSIDYYSTNSADCSEFAFIEGSHLVIWG